jgi:hypothetical protein
LSEPTTGEIEFAARFALDPRAVAAARDALNAIAALPWALPERVSLLGRLARAGRADVGKVLGELALARAPLRGFEELLPIDGLGAKRVAGLARALAKVEIPSLWAESPELNEARTRLAALTAENAALRRELDRWGIKEGDPTPTLTAPAGVMRVGELATSVASQTAVTVEALRTGSRGLRLNGLDLRVTGTAANVGGDLALDVSAPAGGSVMSLSFGTGSDATPPPAELEVPDVRGYAPALARRKLEARGFEPVLTRTAQALGKVAEQTPAPGESARPGTLVHLVIR